MTPNRVPEPHKGYENPQEADIYIRSSQGAVLGIVSRMFVRRILQKFQHKRDLKILDVGSGPGWIPAMLKKIRPPWQITALDYSRHMIRFAQKNAQGQGLHINWIQGSAENMNFEADQFDLVISHYALHEFPNPKAAIKEMIRVTKDGGHILIEDLRRPPRWLMPIIYLNAIFYHFYDRELSRQYLKSTQAAYTSFEVRDFIGDPQFKGKIQIKNIFHLEVAGVVNKKKGERK